jgi:hypothetical protein
MGWTLVPPNTAEAMKNKTGPNLLQFTSLMFLVPAALCVVQRRLAGVLVYSANAVCSVYVHRPNRMQQDNQADTIDKLCVLVWVVYNTVLWLDKKQVAPLGCAVVVLGTKIATQFLVYRSLERYAVHTIMHLAGIGGSLLLLLHTPRQS